MPLTVVLAAYPLALVAPGCIGGAEEIARLIDAGLHAAGHHAIVIAQEGSTLSVSSNAEMAGPNSNECSSETARSKPG